MNLLFECSREFCVPYVASSCITCCTTYGYSSCTRRQMLWLPGHGHHGCGDEPQPAQGGIQGAGVEQDSGEGIQYKCTLVQDRLLWASCSGVVGVLQWCREHLYDRSSLLSSMLTVPDVVYRAGWAAHMGSLKFHCHCVEVLDCTTGCSTECLLYVCLSVCSADQLWMLVLRAVIVWPKW